MTESHTDLVERMQQIADQPETLEKTLARMNDLYETNSFHPQAEAAAAPDDED